ncbi:Cyclin-J [Geodia barretti]|uniref:Cyclin-J n=1 Tax=Geodia barretti TaxID=519541 RepID=A0AA35T6L1_GEOBA|nr:Cyclin-J [Geodia barretti]
MELYLLKFFDWSVSYPTAVHFAEYFLSTEGTEMTEEETCNPVVISGSPLSQQERSEMKAQMDRLTSCFLEASLRETLFLQYPSSLTAAAALCAARICLGLPTAWNHKLTGVTHYDLQTMSHVVDHMLKLFYNDSDA